MDAFENFWSDIRHNIVGETRGVIRFSEFAPFVGKFSKADDEDKNFKQKLYFVIQGN